MTQFPDFADGVSGMCNNSAAQIKRELLNSIADFERMHSGPVAGGEFQTWLKSLTERYSQRLQNLESTRLFTVE